MGGYMFPDVTYNHWTYVEEKMKNEERTTGYGASYSLNMHSCKTLTLQVKTRHIYYILMNFLLFKPSVNNFE